MATLSDRPLPAGSRIACCVEYDGGGYSGWQSQRGAHTVQDALEQALATVADSRVRVHCAGRTDAGVHAAAQWCHFDAPAVRSAKAWVLGTNAQLPPSIRVRHAQPVASDFDARHSASARSYVYAIANTPVAPAMLHGRLTWQRRELDAARMHEAAQCLLGERDFSAFRAAACQSRTPMRYVESLRVQREGALVCIGITANAFLHHMVRNIAGALMCIGTGERDAQWLAAVLAGRDRRLAAATAPPHGLYLYGVRYPGRFQLRAPEALALPFTLPFIFAGG